MDAKKMFAVIQTNLSRFSRTPIHSEYTGQNGDLKSATFKPQDYTNPKFLNHWLLVEINGPGQYTYVLEGDRFMSAWTEVEKALNQQGWKQRS